ARQPHRPSRRNRPGGHLAHRPHHRRPRGWSGRVRCAGAAPESAPADWGRPVNQTEFLGHIGNATAKYEASNPLLRLLLTRFLDRVDEAARSVSPASVLDVGCGEGIVTERLARGLASAQVVGVDADDVRLSNEWRARGA